MLMRFFAAVLAFLCIAFLASAQETPKLWDLARQNAAMHRFSTLFTASQVRDHLTPPEKLQAAVDWCKATGVTKVYIESFRDGYQSERTALANARDRFRKEGFEVSGCITTTRVLKNSTGWKSIPCFTDPPTQEKLQAICEYAAGLFDEIMIDDFLFTDCACPACEAGRKAKTVTVGEKTFPVSDDTWEAYRCELMVQVSRIRILAAAKKINSNVKVIIKYPQWYDRFHERGYEVARQSADFERTWVGTETRDYADKQWGGTPQYEGYFIMRWLGGIGGAKCGGGWYDPYGTTEKTYIEQARQTVLGGARESMLFCYGSLIDKTGPKNIEALRANIPELLAVAGQVSKRPIVGIAAYKPANSHPEKEQRIFDFVGMMGLPLVPCHEFPADAQAAFFSVHAMKDPQLSDKLTAFIAASKPVLITDGLAAALAGKVNLDKPNVRTLSVKGDPKLLLKLTAEELDAIRTPLLKPLGVAFRGPNRVGFYLFKDGSWVVENFNDDPAAVEVGGAAKTIAPRGWLYEWK